MTATKAKKAHKLDRSGVNRIFQVLAFFILYGLLLFGCAGRLDWWEAWAYIIISLLGIVANAAWAFSHDPEVINERGRLGGNAKSWDKVIGLVYTFLLLGGLVVAGLDTRFGWSAVPLSLKITGAVGLVLALAWVFWVMATNTFLSSLVRIQTERGHTTVTSGPYRFVRHPMYAGMFFLFWATPLLLGSWWALIPAALNVALFVLRTSLEDRTLRAELPGYIEYTRKVRYRLIPGIW